MRHFTPLQRLRSLFRTCIFIVLSRRRRSYSIRNCTEFVPIQTVVWALLKGFYVSTKSSERVSCLASVGTKEYRSDELKGPIVLRIVTREAGQWYPCQGCHGRPLWLAALASHPPPPGMENPKGHVRRSNSDFDDLRATFIVSFTNGPPRTRTHPPPSSPTPYSVWTKN